MAVLFLLAFAGCARRESRVASGDRNQILHLGNLSEPSDLDPATVDSVETSHIVMGLMEGLAQYDPKTCLPIPAVADHWEAAADHLSWTFHLRADARWSNGDPVTARDFAYAYRRMLSPGLAAEYASMFFILKNAESFYAGKVAFAQVGVRVADDHTLILELEHPVPYLPRLVCHTVWYPVHPATIEKFGKIDQRGTRWTRPGNYVGNGPFVLAEWVPNQVIRITKSPTYWNRGQIRLNEVDFYPVEDNTTEEAMFRNGELHVTCTIPYDKIAIYRNDPKLRGLLHQEVNLGTYFYRFNVTKPPLNDVRVRRALAYSFSRQQIVEHVSLGGEIPAGHLTPPDTGGFTATAEEPYDPEQARRLLAEAGYPGGTGFPHLEILINTSANHRKMAEAIQQMWRRELGIDVGIYNEDSKVWTDSMRQLDYQIARFGWYGDYLDPSTFLDIMMGDSGNNQTGWRNAEYDRLMEESRQTADEAKRYALFQRCEQILAEECPIAPIFSTPATI